MEHFPPHFRQMDGLRIGSAFAKFAPRKCQHSLIGWSCSEWLQFWCGPTKTVINLEFHHHNLWIFQKTRKTMKGKWPDLEWDAIIPIFVGRLSRRCLPWHLQKREAQSHLCHGSWMNMAVVTGGFHWNVAQHGPTEKKHWGSSQLHLTNFTPRRHQRLLTNSEGDTPAFGSHWGDSHSASGVVLWWAHYWFGISSALRILEGSTVTQSCTNWELVGFLWNTVNSWIKMG